MSVLQWMAACLSCLVSLPSAAVPSPVPGTRAPPTPPSPAPPARPTCASARSPPLALLFVGDSFLARQDVPGLAAYILERAGCRVGEAAAVLRNSTSLAGHERDARDAARLAKLLPPDGGRRWSYVILQDQSETPGLSGSLRFSESLASTQRLAAATAAAGGVPVLYVTHAHRFGDRHLPLELPTFSVMQARIDAGYQTYKREAAPSALLAPVGDAYAAALRAAGAPESLAFGRLYDPDSKHPSPEGAYLGALVLADTIAGACLLDVPAPASLALGAADATELGRWACDAVRGASGGGGGGSSAVKTRLGGG